MLRRGYYPVTILWQLAMGLGGLHSTHTYFKAPCRGNKVFLNYGHIEQLLPNVSGNGL
jgi:hypothetical protein